MRKIVLLFASVATTLLLASGVAIAEPGTLDTTFDGDGTVLTNFADTSSALSMDEAYDVIVQPNGKIVAAGIAAPYQDGDNGGLIFGDKGGFALARYHPDGSLDASFGGDGKVVTNVENNEYPEVAYALAVQPDGKILAGGSVYPGGSGPSGSYLVRYNTDGTLDASFDSDGIASVDIGGEPSALAVQSDGKVVVVRGFSYSGSDVQLLRVNADGTPDTTFDGDGKVQTEFGRTTETTDVAIQDDGKIVASGAAKDCATCEEDFGLIRYNTDGSLDTSFGRAGKVRADIPQVVFPGDTASDDVAGPLTIQPDGKILAGGDAAGGWVPALARFNANGSLDTSFGTNGAVTDDSYVGGLAPVWDLALQSKGQVLALVGYPWSDAAASRPPLVRYNSDGTRDPSFQSTRSVYGYTSLALQPDGKPVLAGFAFSNTGTVRASDFKDFALSRYVDLDTTAPTVAGVSPADLATGVPLTANVEAMFLEDMNPSSITDQTFTLTKQGSSSPVVVSSVVYSGQGKKATLDPASDLQASTSYTATLKGGTSGVKDLAGNALEQDHSWTFTTAAPPPLKCTKTGTANAETISGTSADDVICAGGGNDTLMGLGGNDTLKGEAGNDTLLGGVGNDTLDGGLNTDTASYSASLTAVNASLATNSSTGEGSDTFVGVENLLGSPKVDTLTGSAANNKLTGGGANDTQSGGAGNDTVIGSGGADTLKGEDGADAINSKDGVNGNDSLDGGAGTDTKVTDATEKSIVGFP